MTGAQRGDFGRPTDHERQSIILATIALLDQSTSNSLDPVHRASWIEDRDYLTEKLKELLP